MSWSQMIGAIASSFSSPPSWEPTLLPGLDRWYDFKDESSMTLSTDDITALADKSGNGRNLGGGVAPEKATKDSRVCAYFDTTTYLRDTSNSNLPNGNDAPFTLIFAAQAGVGAANGRPVVFNSSDDGDPYMSFTLNAAGEMTVNRRDDTRAFDLAATTTGAPDHEAAFVVYTILYTGTAITIRADGVQVYTGAMNTNAINNVDRFTVGGSNQQTSFFVGFEGWIGEIILTDAALTQADYEEAEAYMALRWQLEPSEFAGKVVMVNIAGQSNSIGRYGPVDGVLDATDPDVLMWNGSAWVTAADPLDHDGEETADTVGFGLSFAKKLKTDTGASKVLLVGNGLGGSGFLIDSWNALSSAHYESAETRWDAAHAQAVTDYGADLYVGGTLWLQGEDEIIDFSGSSAGQIDGANGGKEYFTMVLSMAHTMRRTLAGYTDDTPFVVLEVPPGSVMTPEALYDDIVAEQALVGTYLNRAAFAAGSDLGTADDRHYTAAAERTIGERAATAIQNLSGDPRAAMPTFTPDASNVSTMFRFDVSNEVNGGQLQILGDIEQWDNRRAWINSGYLAFEDNAELRLGNQDRGYDPTILVDKDFLFKCKVRSTNTASIQGIWSLWDGVSATSRSWVLRFRDDEIQFYYSTTGTDNTKAMFHPVADNTWYEVEIKRVGDALSLTVDNVVEDTHTLPSAGFAFNTPSNTDAKMLLGEYQNAFNLQGDMEYASLELLS